MSLIVRVAEIIVIVCMHVCISVTRLSLTSQNKKKSDISRSDSMQTQTHYTLKCAQIHHRIHCVRVRLCVFFARALLLFFLRSLSSNIFFSFARCLQSQNFSSIFSPFPWWTENICCALFFLCTVWNKNNI